MREQQEGEREEARGEREMRGEKRKYGYSDTGGESQGDADELYRERTEEERRNGRMLWMMTMQHEQRLVMQRAGNAA